MSVKASVLHAPKTLQLEERVLPEPTDDEVQIEITRVGLCGSDLHYYNHFANGAFKVREPLTLGHEAAGRIVKVGTNVNGLQIGDQVALEVGIPCDSCQLCSHGRYNLCPNLRFRSSAKSFPHSQGVLQERVNHPARWCHKTPTNMSSEEAALLEPLAVALHAVKRAGMPSNRPLTTLITGAGAIGLLVAICLKAHGHSVVMADIAEPRLQFALSNGLVDKTVLLPMKRGTSVEEDLEIATSNATSLCDALHELSGDNKESQFDYVFECTGVQGCVQSGIYSTMPGGRVVLVGMGQAVQTLQMSAAALREVDLVGVFRYAHNYTEAIEMFEAGKLKNLAKLVTHRVAGLAAAEDAFTIASKTQDSQGALVIKVMIDLEA